MKYGDLPEDLRRSIVGEVTEHDDGSISVDGNVYWGAKGLTEIPIKFRRVVGNFHCGDNRLTSLENAPDWVGGFFDCDSNHLTSLEGAPDYVGGDFYCVFNDLTSLDGLGIVHGDIYCRKNMVSIEQLIADYQRKRAKKELASESMAIERILT